MEYTVAECQHRQKENDKKEGTYIKLSEINNKGSANWQRMYAKTVRVERKNANSVGKGRSMHVAGEIVSPVSPVSPKSRTSSVSEFAVQFERPRGGGDGSYTSGNSDRASDNTVRKIVGVRYVDSESDEDFAHVSNHRL